MPIAVVIDEKHQEDLQTLPGAYVVIREMTYGERLKRSSLSGSLKLLKDKKSDYAGEIAMQTEKLSLWDFANLIVEHNLQDADERLLNFRDAQDVSKLSAAIGEEIGTLIDKWNSFEDEGN